jgi:hypothetical protein
VGILILSLVQQKHEDDLVWQPSEFFKGQMDIRTDTVRRPYIRRVHSSTLNLETYFYSILGMSIELMQIEHILLSVIWINSKQYIFERF